MVVKELLSVVL